MTAISPSDVGPVTGRRRAGPRRAGIREVLGQAARPTVLSERDIVVSSALLVLSILTGWLILQLLVFGGLEHDRTQDRLYGDFRVELAQGRAPTGGVIAPGAPVAVMSLAAVGSEQVVVEGTSAGQLVGGPGHRRDTVLPGQAGVSVLYGRSTTFGRPFDLAGRDIVGTDVKVVTGQGTATYRIEQVRRSGDPMPAPPASGAGRLTLVTSEGSGFASFLRPGRVIYIDASLSSKPFAAGAARVNTITTSERPMATDPSVLPMLALVLGGLLLVAVGTPVAWGRFGPALTWMIAAPLTLALAWLAADLVVFLLPNLL